MNEFEEDNDQQTIQMLKEQIQSLERQIKKQERLMQQLKMERHEALDLAERYRQGKACLKCQDLQDQYDKMRAGFERRKDDQRAIVALLKHTNWVYEGEPLTITKMIKLGKRYTV